MQYKVQYLDGSNNIIRESSADTTNASEFVTDKNWPAEAVGMRMLDQNGRRILSLTRSSAPAGEQGAPTKCGTTGLRFSTKRTRSFT